MSNIVKYIPIILGMVIFLGIAIFAVFFNKFGGVFLFFLIPILISFAVTAVVMFLNKKD
jgi:Zn-dependent protease with chaperone function